MLNALRNLSKTFAAKILIALLVLSFGVWGISDFVNTIDPTEAGRAGDTSVAAVDFARAYEFASSGFSSRQSRAPTEAENRAIASQVLQSLLAEALQVDAARSLGVAVSDDAVAARIRADEEFSGGDGFDVARFRQFLQDARLSETDYIEREREAAVQELWVNSLAGGVTAPSAYIEAINRYANQSRVVAHFTLADAALDAIPDPSEEALLAFYEANRADFRSPERRSFAVLTLSPEALAEPASVGTEAVRRAYEAEGAYGAAERRTVQQVFLPERDTAQKAAQAINEGYAFEAVLRALGQRAADVSLGTVARGDILNDEVADAAFGLEARKATVADTRFGPALVRVSEIVPSGKEPFEAVEPQIRQALALDEAVDQVRALETSVLDAIAGGDRVADVAARFDLPVATVEAVDRTGATADGTRPEIADRGTVLSSAFGQPEGSDAAEVRAGDTSYWVEVATVAPPADRPFEEVVGEVIAAWTAQERRTRLAGLADEALAALRSGTPAAEVAARYGAEAATSAPFSRAAPPQDVAGPVAEAAFEGPAGSAGMVPAEDGGTTLFVVTAVEEPVFFEDSADIADLRTSLDEGLADSVVFDAMNAWQMEVGATVNQPVVDAVVTGTAISR